MISGHLSWIPHDWCAAAPRTSRALVLNHPVETIVDLLKYTLNWAASPHCRTCNPFDLKALNRANGTMWKLSSHGTCARVTH